MIFSVKKLVQFSNCDPFGIVFYPQYFYICSEAKEDFFIHIGHPHYHYVNVLKLGWPMARLETDFFAPTRFGERIEIQIGLTKIGTSSLGIRYTILGEDNSRRMSAGTTVVLTSLESKKPTPMSVDLKAALEPYLVD